MGLINSIDRSIALGDLDQCLGPVRFRLVDLFESERDDGMPRPSDESNERRGRPAMASLPSWPPQLSPDAQTTLTALAVDYALSHSLVLRPPPAQGGDGRPSQSTVVHAPVALFPTPFPRSCFELASRCVSSRKGNARS